MSNRYISDSQPDFPIDFVMLWVDGSDPDWQKEKNRYLGNDAISTDSRDSRYRDWGTLKYWFRSVEKFTPWVNRIFFVTCGHVPDWLNLSAPKLVHVKHADYMPPEYLPTFSSHPIELNLHRIEALSEHFVYFNDDLFLLKPTRPDFFFREGLPVYPNELRPVSPVPGDIGMANIYMNNLAVINARFSPQETLRDRSRWYSLRTHTVKAAFSNYLFSHHYIRRRFIGFRNSHFAAPILKSTMQLLWEKEPVVLDATSRRKFRDSRDVSQYVFRYWQYATNQFMPEKADHVGKYFGMTEQTIPDICDAIRHRKNIQICLNDSVTASSEGTMLQLQTELLSAFDSILPDKSIFEK